MRLTSPNARGAAAVAGAGRRRDVGRTDVYAAEEAAFEGTVLAGRPGGEALRQAVLTVSSSSWWTDTTGPAGAVRRVSMRTAGDSHWSPRTRTIALDPGESWFVVTHELAHVADHARARPHGPTWRAWNQHLVDVVFGPEFARLLAGAFARFGLVVDPLSPPLGRRAAPPLISLTSASEPERGGWRRP